MVPGSESWESESDDSLGPHETKQLQLRLPAAAQPILPRPTPVDVSHPGDKLYEYIRR